MDQSNYFGNISDNGIPNGDDSLFRDEYLAPEPRSHWIHQQCLEHQLPLNTPGDFFLEPNGKFSYSVFTNKNFFDFYGIPARNHSAIGNNLNFYDPSSELSSPGSIHQECPEFSQSLNTPPDGLSEQNDANPSEEAADSLEEKRPYGSRYTKFQTEALRESFENKRFIKGVERAELARRLLLTPYQIKRWFAEKRYQEKRKLAGKKAVADSGSFGNVANSGSATLNNDCLSSDTNLVEPLSYYSIHEEPSKLVLSQKTLEDELLKQKKVTSAEECRREPKRPIRTRYSEFQKEELKKVFASLEVYSASEKIGNRLDLTSSQVAGWLSRYPNVLKRKEIKMAKKEEREEQKRLKTKADEDRPCHFTKVQRSELKKAFARDKYLSVLARRRLAESLQLTKRQVHAWFRTQRSLEYRKELAKANMEKEQQEMAKRTKDGVSEQGEAKKTPFPTQELCKIFEKQKYLSFLERESLARRLELTSHQIARWFTQKRCKEKAEKKKQLKGTETIVETANATEKSVGANQETDMNHCFESAIPSFLYDECGNEHFPQFDTYLETTSASSTHELEYRKDLEKANLEKEQQEMAKRTEDGVSEQGEAKKTPFPSQELCRIFEKQKYLSFLDRKTLASRLALTPHQVARWFTQKRCKEKAKEKQLKGTETIMETARRSEKAQDLASVEDNQNMEKNACFESAIPPFLYDERGNEHFPQFDYFLETTSASSTHDYNTNDKKFTELKPPQSPLPLSFVPNPYIFQDTYDPVSNGTIQPPNYSSTNGDPPFYLSRVWDPILQIWKKY